jgi:phage gp16-like protein
MPDRRDLAKIHIAKKELKLDDDTYRGVLWDRYGKESAADLSERQAADLIEHFRQKGWRPSSYRQRGLIHVLWRKLSDAGAVEQPGGKSLDGFIEHATGKNDLRKLTVFEASRVIEMLKKWLERVEGGRDMRH